MIIKIIDTVDKVKYNKNYMNIVITEINLIQTYKIRNNKIIILKIHIKIDRLKYNKNYMDIMITEYNLIQAIKIWYNKMNCYTSVYDYKRFGDRQAVISSVILDRLFLDFDSHGKELQLSLDDVKSVLEYLDDTNYTYEIYFSGNGFHCSHIKIFEYES